jgi:type IV pilus assembly protein PilB
MRISDSLVEKLLKQSGKASPKQLRALQEQQAKTHAPLQDLAISHELLTERELTKLYASEIDIPFVALNTPDVRRTVLKRLPERIARRYKVVAFDTDANGSLSVAMANPGDTTARTFLEKQLGKNLNLFVTTEASVTEVLDHYYGSSRSALAKVVVFGKDNFEDEVVDDAEDPLVVQTVNLIIEYAVNSHASDIHIEPREKFVIIRYRIDGVLRVSNKLPQKVFGALLSRVKTLGGLSVTEHRTPQSGRCNIEIAGQTYVLRVFVVPVVDGEKIVIRILDESLKAASLQTLGLWGEARQHLEHTIMQPHGMVLATGPTGSGKSTTLFSLLTLLNAPSLNIATIEDPVKYRLIGANQTQVDPAAGITFSKGLQAILAQDPNVIMVSELRDLDTANLSIQTATTGHLVLGGMHATTTAASIVQLIRMGVEPFLLASVLRTIVAGQLVRKLCVHCRQSFVPTATQLKLLEKEFSINDAGARKQLHGYEMKAHADGVGASTQGFSTNEHGITRLFQSTQEGCERCNHTGYHGRIGIYEVLTVSTAMQRLIGGNSPGREAIEAQAKKEGMLPLKLDGLIKVLRGETSIDEVLKITT